MPGGPRASEVPSGPQASGSTPGRVPGQRAVSWKVVGSNRRPGPVSEPQPAPPELASADSEPPLRATGSSGAAWDSVAHLRRQLDASARRKSWLPGPGMGDPGIPESVPVAGPGQGEEPGLPGPSVAEVRVIVPHIAPSADAADLTIAQLTEYQVSHELPPPAGPSIPAEDVPPVTGETQTVTDPASPAPRDAPSADVGAADGQSPATPPPATQALGGSQPAPPVVEDVEADLLGFAIDAIVNPTDPALRSTEGISGQILARGGQVAGAWQAGRMPDVPQDEGDAGPQDPVPGDGGLPPRREGAPPPDVAAPVGRSGDSGQPSAGPPQPGGSPAKALASPAVAAAGGAAVRTPLSEAGLRQGGAGAGLGVALPTPVEKRSGYYLPGGPALDDARARAADELASAWFPSVTGAKAWHLHLDPQTGYVLAGDQAVAPEEFYDAMIAAQGWPPDTLLVIVGCGAAATAPGAPESAARVLARRGGRPVLAADTDVWTTPDGQVLAAPAEFDELGRPVLGTARGHWGAGGGRREAVGQAGLGPAGHPARRRPARGAAGRDAAAPGHRRRGPAPAG